MYRAISLEWVKKKTHTQSLPCHVLLSSVSVFSPLFDHPLKNYFRRLTHSTSRLIHSTRQEWCVPQACLPYPVGRKQFVSSQTKTLSKTFNERKGQRSEVQGERRRMVGCVCMPECQSKIEKKKKKKKPHMVRKTYLMYIKSGRRLHWGFPHHITHTFKCMTKCIKGSCYSWPICTLQWMKNFELQWNDFFFQGRGHGMHGQTFKAKLTARRGHGMHGQTFKAKLTARRGHGTHGQTFKAKLTARRGRGTHGQTFKAKLTARRGRGMHWQTFKAKLTARRGHSMHGKTFKAKLTARRGHSMQGQTFKAKLTARLVAWEDSSRRWRAVRRCWSDLECFVTEEEEDQDDGEKKGTTMRRRTNKWREKDKPTSFLNSVDQKRSGITWFWRFFFSGRSRLRIHDFLFRVQGWNLTDVEYYPAPKSRSENSAIHMSSKRSTVLTINGHFTLCSRAVTSKKKKKKKSPKTCTLKPWKILLNKGEYPVKTAQNIFGPFHFWDNGLGIGDHKPLIKPPTIEWKIRFSEIFQLVCGKNRWEKIR